MPELQARAFTPPLDAFLLIGANNKYFLLTLLCTAIMNDKVKHSIYIRQNKGDGSNFMTGNRRFTLNGEPLFLYGPLDQGYFPDGLYTPPSEEAMLFDIEYARKIGCNMIRKHIKVEPLRWYYHCDRLGMIVWQDMPTVV